MKTITTKKALLLSLVSSFFFFSCQREAIEETTDSNAKVESVKNDGSIIPGMYIVKFKEEFIPSGKFLNKGKQFTDRAEKGKIFVAREKEVKETINNFLRKNEISEKNVTAYYASAVSGVALKLSDEQFKKLKGLKEIEAIDNDRLMKMDDAKVENVSKAAAASPYYQTVTCAITNAGGSVDASSSYTWVWVIDSGIDLTHPDLNVVSYAPYAQTFVPDTADADDCNGHGTHVAGIAAAKNNGFGVVGVAAGAPVVPVRVFNCTGTTPTSRVISAINHVATYDIAGDVANLSLGGYFGSTCASSTTYIAALNTLATTTRIAIAAGNSGAPAYEYQPGCVNGSNIFTIASMECDRTTFAWDSNYGRNTVDFIATGQYVYSTYKDGGYATLRGTSMAAPVVAGIMLARNAPPVTGGWLFYNSEWYPIASR